MSSHRVMAKEVVERLFQLARNNPDEAISVIGGLIRETPGIDEVPAMRAIRSFAVGTKAWNLFSQSGNAMNEPIRDLCEMSLSDLRHARENDVSFRLAPFDKLLDSLAEIMEPTSPGRTQELMGLTKIRWIHHAGRVGISWGYRNFLNSDLWAEIGTLELVSAFPIRSIYVTAACTPSPEMDAMLFDDPSAGQSPDQVNSMARSQVLNVKKDVDTTWRGKPRNPTTYNKWQIKLS